MLAFASGCVLLIDILDSNVYKPTTIDPEVKIVAAIDVSELCEKVGHAWSVVTLLMFATHPEGLAPRSMQLLMDANMLWCERTLPYLPLQSPSWQSNWLIFLAERIEAKLSS